jgi:hypothetical protein
MHSHFPLINFSVVSSGSNSRHFGGHNGCEKQVAFDQFSDQQTNQNQQHGRADKQRAESGVVRHRGFIHNQGRQGQSAGNAECVSLECGQTKIANQQYGRPLKWRVLLGSQMGENQ